jgi:hypothetical protein
VSLLSSVSTCTHGRSRPQCSTQVPARCAAATPKFSGPFDEVFRTEAVRVICTPVRSLRPAPSVRPEGCVCLSEDPLEMALPEDQEVVQALAPHRLHEALGKGVRLRVRLAAGRRSC